MRVDVEKGSLWILLMLQELLDSKRGEDLCECDIKWDTNCVICVKGWPSLWCQVKGLSLIATHALGEENWLS